MGMDAAQPAGAEPSKDTPQRCLEDALIVSLAGPGPAREARPDRECRGDYGSRTTQKRSTQTYFTLSGFFGGAAHR